MFSWKFNLCWQTHDSSVAPQMWWEYMLPIPVYEYMWLSCDGHVIIMFPQVLLHHPPITTVYYSLLTSPTPLLLLWGLEEMVLTYNIHTSCLHLHDPLYLHVHTVFSPPHTNTHLSSSISPSLGVLISALRECCEGYYTIMDTHQKLVKKRDNLASNGLMSEELRQVCNDVGVNWIEYL